MKIRNGFVSNSSSSSFTCDVCGETESGWDVSLSDIDMSECIRGHIFCNGHQTRTPTTAEKRENLINGEKHNTFQKPEEIEQNVAELSAMSDEEIEEAFTDQHDPYEVMPCLCPICTMDKLQTSDGYRYLLKKNGLDCNTLLAEIRDRFGGDYGQFEQFLKT